MLKLLELLLLQIISSQVKDVSLFQQNDYTVKLLILQVKSYNYSYFRDLKAELSWYNRTQRATDVSFYLLKDLTNNLKVLTQMYKFSSNEYRLFPIAFSTEFCKEMITDRFGVVESFKDSVNIVPRCPFKKGFYSLKKGVVDFSRFPPHVPTGQYLNKLELLDGNDFLLELLIECKIESVIKKWEY